MHSLRMKYPSRLSRCISAACRGLGRRPAKGVSGTGDEDSGGKERILSTKAWSGFFHEEGLKVLFS